MNNKALVVLVLLLGVVSLSAETLTLVSNTTQWRQSTTYTVNDTYPGWPGVSSLPSVGTFTIVPTAGGLANVVAGSTAIYSANSIRYYRATFVLPTISDITADLQISVDNDVHIFINGQWLALEGSLAAENFSSLPHHRVFVDSNTNVVNGYSGGQAFDSTVSTFADSNWLVGTNEIILAVRNLSGGDAGAFSFRMDLNYVVSTVPEPSSLLLCLLVGLFYFRKPLSK